MKTAKAKGSHGLFRQNSNHIFKEFDPKRFKRRYGLRIGLDAKWYFGGNVPSGTMVVRNLISQLSKIDSPNEYFLIMRKEDRSKTFPVLPSNFHIVYVWGRNNFLSNLICVRLKAIELRLDVVLFQNFCSPSCKYKSIAFIYDVLFLSYPQYFSRIERVYFSFIKPLARKADVLCTISESEKNRLIEYKFKDNRDDIKVVYLGVEERFIPAENYDEKKLDEVKKRYALPDQYLLFVGRLNARKNLSNLLKAISLLTNKEIPLVMVGKPSWKTEDIDEQIQKSNLANRIFFTGFVSDEDLPMIFSLSRIFCFPSFAEAFGLPPLEAMACGIPVVVSNIACLREICGEAGTYINPHEPIEISNAIDKLLLDEQYYEQQHERGIKQSAKFTWEKAARIVLEACETLIKE